MVTKTDRSRIIAKYWADPRFQVLAGAVAFVMLVFWCSVTQALHGLYVGSNNAHGAIQIALAVMPLLGMLATTRMIMCALFMRLEALSITGDFFGRLPGATPN